MTTPTSVSQSNLAACEALYRLALLVLGDPHAAETATWQTLGSGAPGSGLNDLAPALLKSRVGRWRYKPSPQLLARSGLSAGHAEALLDALPSLTPTQRLALGLATLRSMPWAEALMIAGAGRRPPDPRPQLGTALGMLPTAEADLPVVCHRCIEAIKRDEEEMGPAARQHLAGCEQCQSVRAGWKKTNVLLREALPALFVAPPEVLRRFANPPSAPARRGRLRPLALLGAVILVVLFFILRGGREVGPALSDEPLTAGQVIDRTINRFNLRPASGPIVHEIVEIDLAPLPLPSGVRRPQALQTLRLTLERWYDYGPPARLRVELRQGDRPIYVIAMNGQGQIQTDARLPFLGETGTTIRSTVALSPELEAQYIPLLRQPLANGLLPGFLGASPPASILALQTARANPGGVLPLGSTSALDRPAWLLSVAGEDHDYLLTIDQETYAIVDIQEVRPGELQEGRHPWRTTLLEVLESAPSTTFQLSTGAWGERVTGPVQPLNWFIPAELEEVPTVALQPSRFSSLLPPLLPDPDVVPASLSTIIWDSLSESSGVVTIFWNEYGLIALVQTATPGIAPLGGWPHEEAGRRFAMEGTNSVRRSVLLVRVDTSSLLPGARTGQLLIQIHQPLATDEERESIARQIIRSLEPAGERRLQRFLHFGPNQ